MTPQKFWMVWLKDSPTTEKRWSSFVDAQIEADRIARKTENVGKKVYVLQSVDYRFVELSLTHNDL